MSEKNYTNKSRLQSKYIVAKTNGDPVDPEAEYLVLRLDTDPHARTAALAWADAIESEAPNLAADIRQRVYFYESGTR